MDPDLPWPEPSSDYTSLDLGKVSTESSKTVSVKLYNSGRGFLSGVISLVGPGSGFAIDQQVIEGEPVTVQITIRPPGLPVGSRQKTAIVVQTNGGTLEIPISYGVSAPLASMIGRSILVGLGVGGALGLLRLIIQANLPRTFPRSRDGLLDWVDWNYAWSHPEQGGFILAMVALVGIIGGGIY